MLLLTLLDELCALRAFWPVYKNCRKALTWWRGIHLVLSPVCWFLDIGCLVTCTVVFGMMHRGELVFQ